MGEDGVMKVLRGLTTLSEIERVTDISSKLALKRANEALATAPLIEEEAVPQVIPTEDPESPQAAA